MERFKDKGNSTILSNNEDLLALFDELQRASS